MPTPRVSVPQMTASRPAWASVSTSRRYLGSIPAWWTPMPWSTQALERGTEALAEAEPADGLLDRGLACRGDDVDAHQRLGVLHRGGLGERHDVDGGAVVAQEQLEGVVQRGEDPLELQRHGALGPGHRDGLAAGAPGQVLLEDRGVTEGRRHEEELRPGHEQQRHLPGPAAVGLGVEVELVHDDEADVGELPLAQGVVGEDLGRRADDGGAGVDRRVSGEHPDVPGAEDLDEGEELLAHQRLDGRGVPAAPAVGDRLRVGGHGDERLPGAGRRGEDDVRPSGEGEDGLLLGGVEREAALTGPVEEDVEGTVRARGGVAGEAVGERHRPRSSPIGGRSLSRAARGWPRTTAGRAR